MSKVEPFSSQQPHDLSEAEVVSESAEALARTQPNGNAIVSQPELPVVARLVVEIRSDGSRTIARGGLEDVASGHKVAIEAQGATPLSLAVALARSLTQLPRLRFSPSRLRSLLRREPATDRLLPGKKGKPQ